LSEIAVSNDVMPQSIFCSICGGNPISAPEGTVRRTRFTCRRCSARISRRKDEALGRAFGAAERAREEYERNRRMARLALTVAGVSKTTDLGQG
jgi:adenine-specific DNA methylase